MKTLRAGHGSQQLTFHMQITNNFLPLLLLVVVIVKKTVVLKRTSKFGIIK